MKLNYKKTILVGFAFFLIMAFWKTYDTIVPLILENKFNMSSTFTGVIMAIDNVLALFMLPLFGAISDKTNTKYGKRTPYIFIGTIFACVFFVIATVVSELILFVVVLLLVLISMAIFRSPAVALMPDITPKPLRSKGNAVINLMGACGGIIVLGLGILLKTSVEGKTDFTLYAFSVVGVMLVALVIFLLTVKEPLWTKQMQEESEKLEESTDMEETKDCFVQTNKKLSKSKLISLMLILSSVALWYMGYNAVETAYSRYAPAVLNKDFNLTLIIAQVAAIISYIPIGIMASKFGRKKTLLAGILMLATAFFVAIFARDNWSDILMYVLFALAGIGWATISVNSFPMVVELAKGSNVGKYTGYYYTASMLAQVLTPMLSGFIFDIVGNYLPLFIYATIFVGLSFITMFFVKHGDSKPQPKKDLLEALDVGDD